MNKIITFILSTFLVLSSLTTQASNENSATKRSGFFSWFSKSKKEVPSEEKADSAKSKGNYDKLIKDAVDRHEGVINTFRVKEDFYFNIPTSLLGREFLIVNKLQRVQEELTDAGINKGIEYENKMVRFELQKIQKRIVLRQVKPTPVVPAMDAIGFSVRDNFIAPIIGSLSVEAFNSDSTQIIVKVTSLYNGTDTFLNDLFNLINLGTSADSKTSRIISARSFERNVVVRSELTSKVRDAGKTIFVTTEVSSSLVLLDEKPMIARYEHPRVGYFTVNRMLFADSIQRMDSRKLITRWRLEPKQEDIEAYRRGELVEPKNPIVFYIDRSTPRQWVPYLKKGVEDWNLAFEKAGFKNAIVAKEVAADQDVDADDVSHSVITYVASPKVNAMGPSLVDPRSGEIIEADIIWWHNVMTMLQKWITVQTGATNPEARSIHLSDPLMGDAMRFVACHEVGHSLGLRHNMMGSWAFPTDSLRNPAFIEKYKGTSSSIMDYARYNYVAQPGDGIKTWSPAIGPYDIFAIEFGYRWTGESAPEGEKTWVNSFMKQHQGNLYKYADAQDGRNVIDPRAQSEDLGDDPVKSSTYGIDNLKRVVPEIIRWTTTGEVDQSYLEAGRLYLAVVAQWNNYLYHVLANVGGIYIDYTTVGDGQKNMTYVEKEKQQTSVRFLIKEVLSPVDWLFNADVTNYVYPTQSTPYGYIENAPTVVLSNAQSYILWDIMDNRRLIRMLENEAQNGNKAYTAINLMDDLHKHIFGITERGGVPNLMERRLQKGLVDALILSASESATNKTAKGIASGSFNKDFCGEVSVCGCDDHKNLAREINFNGSQADRISDAISVKRGELLRIRDLLVKGSNNANPAVKYHYKDLLLRINTSLGIR